MTEQRNPDQIQTDIEQTREELADTAAALAQKADVKARAHDKVDEVKAKVTGKVDSIKGSASEKTPDSAAGAAQSVNKKVRENPIPTAAVSAALLGFALGYISARR